MKGSLLEQDYNDFTTSPDTDNEQVQEETPEQKEHIAKITKCQSIVSSVERILTTQPLVGCRRTLYLYIQQLYDLYGYVAQNKDELGDKLAKIAKMFELFTKKLVEEVKLCLQK